MPSGSELMDDPSGLLVLASAELLVSDGQWDSESRVNCFSQHRIIKMIVSKILLDRLTTTVDNSIENDQRL